MKLTQSESARIVRMLEHYGSAEAARHDCQITIQSLGGVYTDRATSRMIAILDWLIAADQKWPETAERRRGQLRRLSIEPVPANPAAFEVAR